MKRSTVELCIDVLENGGVQQIGKPENRAQVERIFDALDDLRGYLVNEWETER